MAKKLTKEEWIEKARAVHGDKYDYSKVIYTNSKDYVTIICPVHGEFQQKAGNHLKYGCAKCAGNKHITKEEFIEISTKIHNGKFDYSKVENFKNIKELVTIICPIHGEFQQRVEDHMKGCGCNKCRCSKSKIHDPIPNKHNMKEYKIWKGMKTRVTNSNIDCADRYSKRGISCSDEWLESFEAFYSDMGPCPEGYSLDRIDVNGNYCKENCRWTNIYTQAQNKEFNKLYTYNGETHVLKEWSRILNFNYGTVYGRISKGMSFEEAIQEDPYKKLIEFNGEKHNLKDWCKIYNIKYMTVINRIHSHGWTFERAITTPGKPFGN